MASIIFKKLFILIVVINFHSFLKADDINDFEINGMSIGDSALKFFSQEDLQNKRFMYDDKTYASAAKLLVNDIYEGVSIEFKANDENYQIKAMNGKILYDNKNFQDCYKVEKKIVAELKEIFKNNSKYNYFGITSHPGDKTGKSTGSHHQFTMNDGSGYIMVECMNWSEEIGYTDNLKVSIITAEFNDWLDKVYK